MIDKTKVDQLHVVLDSNVMKACLGNWRFPQKRINLVAGDLLHIVEFRREAFGVPHPWFLATRNGDHIVWIRPQWFVNRTTTL